MSEDRSWRSDVEVDDAVRRSLATANGVAALIVTVMAIAALGTALIGSFASLGFAICALGAARLPPRPWPLVDRPPGIVLESGSVRGTVLVASRSEGLAFAAFMFGLAVILVAGLLELDYWNLVTTIRGGWAGVVWPVIQPVLLALAVAWLARPTVLRLSPEGVSVRQVIRTVELGWDEVLGVGVQDSNTLVLTLSRRGTENGVNVHTARLALSLWELRAVLRHYLEHPEHRGELGTPASLERIEELRREQTVPGWKPDWLPAPRV